MKRWRDNCDEVRQYLSSHQTLERLYTQPMRLKASTLHIER